jgi:hypothetical protein
MLDGKSMLTFSWAPFPVGLVDVDIPGQTKVGNLAELPLPNKHVASRQVTMHQLKK